MNTIAAVAAIKKSNETPVRILVCVMSLNSPFKENSPAIVAGINKSKKHQKPDNNQAGGIIEKEMPIHISNIAYFDSSSKKGIKIGYKFDEKNKKIRINKSTGKEI